VPASEPYLTIALPVKDGEARLQQTLDEVEAAGARLGRAFEIVAVDDGSTDGTRGILERHAAGRPHVRVLVHDENQGKGAALKSAAAVSRGAILATIDADATYALDGLPDFLAAIEAGCDAAIGNRRDARTRFLLNPRDFAYVGRRHAMGWLFGWLGRVITGVRVADFQAGYKVYRGEVARRLFPQVEAQRFAFDVEILALLQHGGHRIAELPVTYVYRHQPSTVKLFRDGFRMVARLLRVRRKLRRLRRSGRFADHTRGDYQDLARREGHPVQRFWHAKKWPLVVDKLQFRASDRVLEVGAGSSEIPQRTSERVALSCATDFSPAPLAYLASQGLVAGEDGGSGSGSAGQGAADAARPRVCLVGADIQALPFRDGSFDKVIVLEVIEHVPAESIPRYFGELRRVLAPGGELLVTTPNYRSSWPLLEWLVDHFGGAAQMGGKQHIARFHPGRLRAALERGGFRVKQSGSVYHLSPFLAPLSLRGAERVFAWELRRGGRWGPILYSVAEAGPR